MNEKMIFISFSSWYWIDSVPSKPGKISESRRWGRRSCKQLSDTVTERKNDYIMCCLFHAYTGNFHWAVDTTNKTPAISKVCSEDLWKTTG